MALIVRRELWSARVLGRALGTAALALAVGCGQLTNKDSLKALGPVL